MSATTTPFALHAGVLPGRAPIDAAEAEALAASDAGHGSAAAGYRYAHGLRRTRLARACGWMIEMTEAWVDDPNDAAWAVLRAHPLDDVVQTLSPAAVRGALAEAFGDGTVLDVPLARSVVMVLPATDALDPARTLEASASAIESTMVPVPDRYVTVKTATGWAVGGLFESAVEAPTVTVVSEVANEFTASAIASALDQVVDGMPIGLLDGVLVDETDDVSTALYDYALSVGSPVPSKGALLPFAVMDPVRPTADQGGEEPLSAALARWGWATLPRTWATRNRPAFGPYAALVTQIAARDIVDDLQGRPARWSNIASHSWGPESPVGRLLADHDARTALIDAVREINAYLWERDLLQPQTWIETLALALVTTLASDLADEFVNGPETPTTAWVWSIRDGITTDWTALFAHQTATFFRDETHRVAARAARTRGGTYVDRDPVHWVGSAPDPAEVVAILHDLIPAIEHDLHTHQTVLTHFRHTWDSDGYIARS